MINWRGLSPEEFVYSVYKGKHSNILCKSIPELIVLKQYIERIFGLYTYTNTTIDDFPIVVNIKADRRKISNNGWEGVRVRNPMRIRAERIEYILETAGVTSECTTITDRYKYWITDFNIIAKNIISLGEEDVKVIKNETYKQELMKGL